MNKRLLSVKELAVELGVCVYTIRRAYWNGRIPGFKICKVLRFDITRVYEVLGSGGLSTALQAAAVRVGDSRPQAGGRSPRVGKTGAQLTPSRRKNRGIQQQR